MNLEKIIHSGSLLDTDQRAAVHQELLTSLDQRTELEMRLKTLNERIDLCHTALSPVRTLPTETLQEIFLHCLPTGYNALMNAAEPPLLLGRVCHRWRAVAMDTPALWASIHIELCPPRNVQSQRIFARYEAQVDAIATWLDRAGKQPLSISFREYQSSELSRTTNREAYVITQYSLMGKVMEILVRHSETWCDIALAVDCDIFQGSGMKSLTAGDVPLLRSFKYLEALRALSGTVSDVSVSTQCVDFCTDYHGLLSGPAIREVELYRLFNPLKHQVCSSLPAQLTVLNLQANSGYDGQGKAFGDLSRLLQHCTKLQECRFGVACWEEISTPTEIASMSLPDLHTFLLVGCPWTQSATGFFDKLHAPRIASFRCYHARQSRPTAEEFQSSSVPCPPWSRFLEKYGHTIESLGIEDLILACKELRSFLKGNRTLKNLRISTPCIHPFAFTHMNTPHQSQESMAHAEFLELLLPNRNMNGNMSLIASSEVLCPHLESLELPYCSASDDTLACLLKSRAEFSPDEHPPRFKSAVIWIERYNIRDIAAELPSGFNLTLKYTSPYGTKESETAEMVERWQKLVDWDKSMDRFSSGW